MNDSLLLEGDQKLIEMFYFIIRPNLLSNFPQIETDHFMEYMKSFGHNRFFFHKIQSSCTGTIMKQYTWHQ